MNITLSSAVARRLTGGVGRVSLTQGSLQGAPPGVGARRRAGRALPCVLPALLGAAVLLPAGLPPAARASLFAFSLAVVLWSTTRLGAARLRGRVLRAAARVDRRDAAGALLHGALTGATLRPRYDVMGEYLSIDRALDEADLVFTAEGGLDFQTPRGEIPAVVAQKAKERDLPVVALAGTVGEGAEVNYPHGIDVFMSMLGRPSSLSEAIEAAPVLLAGAAECAMRLLVVGRQLWKRLPSEPQAHEVREQPLRCQGVCG